MATKEIVRSKMYGNDLSVQTINARGALTVARMNAKQFREATGLKGNAASKAYNEYLRTAGRNGNGHLHQMMNDGMEVHQVRQLAKGGLQFNLYPTGHFDRQIREAKPKRLFTDKQIQRTLDALGLTGESRAIHGAKLAAAMK